MLEKVFHSLGVLVVGTGDHEGGAAIAAILSVDVTSGRTQGEDALEPAARGREVDWQPALVVLNIDVGSGRDQIINAIGTSVKQEGNVWRALCFKSLTRCRHKGGDRFSPDCLYN